MAMPMGNSYLVVPPLWVYGNTDVALVLYTCMGIQCNVQMKDASEQLYFVLYKEVVLFGRSKMYKN